MRDGGGIKFCEISRMLLFTDLVCAISHFDMNNAATAAQKFKSNKKFIIQFCNFNEARHSLMQYKDNQNKTLFINSARASFSTRYGAK